MTTQRTSPEGTSSPALSAGNDVRRRASKLHLSLGSNMIGCTLGARDFSSAVSGTAEDVSAFGQRQKFPLHARKTSGTQGRLVEKVARNFYSITSQWRQPHLDNRLS